MSDFTKCLRQTENQHDGYNNYKKISVQVGDNNNCINDYIGYV